MRLLVAATLLMLIAQVQAASPEDPYAGRWTLNLARSGSDARSQVLTIHVSGNEETYRSELILADGKRQVTEYTAAYDGREYPSRTVITDANGAATHRDDTVILRKVDPFTRERHWKQGGRVVRILRRIVSQDGRKLTSQVIDVDEQGRERQNGTLVFERT
jgi:hypothetical protein